VHYIHFQIEIRCQTALIERSSQVKRPTLIRLSAVGLKVGGHERNNTKGKGENKKTKMLKTRRQRRRYPNESIFRSAAVAEKH
jgi:hypothetical protein